MMSWLYYGFTQILEPGFDVVRSLETIQREKATHYLGVPSLYIFMLDHPRFKEFDLSSLRFVSFGGFEMPEREIKRLLDAWPWVKICNVYALTEAGPGGTFMEIFQGSKKLNSVGLPWTPDQEIRIVDDHDKDVKVGEIGEILIKGPNVMKEYYKDPEATREAIRNGWLHTGDLGSYDDDGYFYYMGRKKDMIVRGGFNVYAMEVENVILEHPAVKQCAVVGKPHPKLGEDIVAFLVIVEGERISPDEVISFCIDRLADFKRPREIRFLDSLPMTPGGKVDKKAMRLAHLDT
jgi:acyl-CoA synthetase (AMP-forming)/AMP-acid ligase II